MPGGKAKLVLKKLSDEDITRMANGTEIALNDVTPVRLFIILLIICSPLQSPVEVLTGIGVKVQFPTFKGYIPLESLSGESPL